MGIHIFSLEEITESIGLNREYRKFWNEKAYELCSDKEIRHKLKLMTKLQYKELLILGLYIRVVF